MADDLSEKLDRLFSSPDGMKRVEDMMKAFGISAPQTPFEQASAPSAAPKQQMPAGPSADSAEMPELDLILKLAPLIGQMGKEDENTALLHALRFYMRIGLYILVFVSVVMMCFIKMLPIFQGIQLICGFVVV